MPVGKYTRKTRPAIRPISASIAYIELTKGQFCLVDIDDADELEKSLWHSSWDKHSKSFRAQTNIPLGPRKQRREYMHSRLIDVPAGMLPDHRNRNPLDNRRSNLRVATPRQNAINRSMRSDNKSGYKGVYFLKNQTSHLKWVAMIDGEFLGCYSSPEEAHVVYFEAAKRLHGDFVSM